MIKNLLLCGLLLCALGALKAQDYLNQDVTLMTGTYTYSGVGSITITVPQGQVVQINSGSTYYGANLVVNGQLTMGNNPGRDVQIGGTILLGKEANLTVDGHLISSKAVTLGEDAGLTVTGNYDSNLGESDGTSVHLLARSFCQVAGNAIFHTGRLVLDAGSVFTTAGDMKWNRSGCVISGALNVGSTLFITSGPNQLNCPGSITTVNLHNDAGITPSGISGSGYFKITGNSITGSGNPLTSDPTIVVDYSGPGGNFGAATRATGNPCTVTLPVKLRGFSAVYQQRAVGLSWQSETEVNNKGFYIQRSSDAVHFSTIGFVASKAVNGISSQVLEYSYQDAAPGLHNYYRLQQEQLNGQMSYSAIIYVQDLSGAQAGATTVKVFPVPAVDMIRFITNKAGLLLVFDQNGRQVLSRLVSVGENKIGIQQLKSGVYFYRINNQQGRFIKK